MIRRDPSAAPEKHLTNNKKVLPDVHAAPTCPAKLVRAKSGPQQLVLLFPLTPEPFALFEHFNPGFKAPDFFGAVAA